MMFQLHELTFEQSEGKMSEAALAGVTQLVECNLAKVDVAGSNPVSRSILQWSVPDTLITDRS
jgi:hypothetical protein